MPAPCLLDCDPGHDDAIALLLAAAHPALDLRAVSTVAGNGEIDRVTHNALAVCTLARIRDVPVAQGAAGPRGATLEVATDIHGESALDGAVLPEPDVALDPRPGARLIAETIAAAPEPLTLFATGPLTNVAEAFETADLAGVREVVWMGGSTERGNRAPYAEFNAWADPEAAAAVLASGVPFTMVGLNLTHQALATAEVIARLAALATPLVGRRRRLAVVLRHHVPHAVRLPGAAGPRPVRRRARRGAGRRARPSTRSSRSRPRAAGRAARPWSTSTAGSGRRRTPAWRPSSTSRASGTWWSTRSRSWGADVLPRGLAPLLVFVASGAVLVLEILGVRLLAPYVGLTLETYTTIIGVVLAGIAIGAAAGGRAADRVPARPLLALLLAGGGLLALSDRPARAGAGRGVRGRGHGERAWRSRCSRCCPRRPCSAR